VPDRTPLAPVASATNVIPMGRFPKHRRLVVPGLDTDTVKVPGFPSVNVVEAALVTAGAVAVTPALTTPLAMVSVDTPSAVPQSVMSWARVMLPKIVADEGPAYEPVADVLVDASPMKPEGFCASAFPVPAHVIDVGAIPSIGAGSAPVQSTFADAFVPLRTSAQPLSPKVVADVKAPVTVVEGRSVWPPCVQFERAKVVVAVSDPEVALDVIGGLKLMLPETPTQVAVPVAMMAVEASADALWAPAMTLSRGTDARHAIKNPRLRDVGSERRMTARFPRYLRPWDTANRMVRVDIVPPFLSSRS
jgi:hypothetical protein